MTDALPTIIIIADSRGKGLEEFIDQHPESNRFNNIVKILPGRNLNQIAIETIQSISGLNSQDYYCIILAGICSLTEVTRIAGSKRIHYPLHSRDTKITDITGTIRDLKHRFADSINICTIIPASLTKYFNHYNPGKPLPEGLEQEQSALIDDINTINTEIINANSQTVTNINLSKRVLIQSKKKKQRRTTESYRRIFRFSDTELPDGVHFSDSLKSICFSLIYETAIRDLQHQSPPPPAAVINPYSSQDSQDLSRTLSGILKERHPQLDEYFVLSI